MNGNLHTLPNPTLIEIQDIRNSMLFPHVGRSVSDMWTFSSSGIPFVSEWPLVKFPFVGFPFVEPFWETGRKRIEY